MNSFYTEFYPVQFNTRSKMTTCHFIVMYTFSETFIVVHDAAFHYKYFNFESVSSFIRKQYIERNFNTIKYLSYLVEECSLPAMDRYSVKK